MPVANHVVASPVARLAHTHRRHWTRRASFSTLCADAVAVAIWTAVVLGWVAFLIAIAWELKAVAG